MNFKTGFEEFLFEVLTGFDVAGPGGRCVWENCDVCILIFSICPITFGDGVISMSDVSTDSSVKV